MSYFLVFFEFAGGGAVAFVVRGAHTIHDQAGGGLRTDYLFPPPPPTCASKTCASRVRAHVSALTDSDVCTRRT